MESITVTSPEATMAIGAKLGQLVQPGDLILLDGDLGAGKTTFTKGLAKAWAFLITLRVRLLRSSGNIVRGDYRSIIWMFTAWKMAVRKI